MSGEDVTLRFGATGTKEIIADIDKMTTAVRKFQGAASNISNLPMMMSGDAYSQNYKKYTTGTSFPAKPPEYIYSKEFTSVNDFSEKMRKMNWDWLPKFENAFMPNPNQPRGLGHMQIPDMNKVYGYDALEGYNAQMGMGFQPRLGAKFPKMPPPPIGEAEAKWYAKQDEEEAAFYARKTTQQQKDDNDLINHMTKISKDEENWRKSMDRTTRGSLLFFGLGVMFAGMALEKAAKGFLQPAMEAAGVAEIFGAALTLLFLPAALLLIPLAVWFLEEVNKMSPELKMVIGGIVLLALALGMVMTIIGQTATFISSMMQAPTVFADATKFFDSLASPELMTSITNLGAKIASIWNSPVGALIIAALTVETMRVLALKWGEDKPQTKVDAPFVYEGVEGASALAQQTPYIGGFMGGTIEAAGELAMLTGYPMFGEAKAGYYKELTPEEKLAGKTQGEYVPERKEGFLRDWLVRYMAGDPQILIDAMKLTGKVAVPSYDYLQAGWNAGDAGHKTYVYVSVDKNGNVEQRVETPKPTGEQFFSAAQSEPS